MLDFSDLTELLIACVSDEKSLLALETRLFASVSIFLRLD